MGVLRQTSEGLHALNNWCHSFKIYPEGMFTWAVDVHLDGFPGVLGLQEEHLCHHQAGVLITHLQGVRLSLLEAALGSGVASDSPLGVCTGCSLIPRLSLSLPPPPRAKKVWGTYFSFSCGSPPFFSSFRGGSLGTKLGKLIGGALP